MADVTFTAVVHDPHSLSLYDVKTGSYQGVIYVTSGAIVGQPIISGKTLNVSFQEGGKLYMSTYELPSRSYVRKITI
jgi:hypothetical protein